MCGVHGEAMERGNHNQVEKISIIAISHDQIFTIKTMIDQSKNQKNLLVPFLSFFVGCVLVN